MTNELYRTREHRVHFLVVGSCVSNRAENVPYSAGVLSLVNVSTRRHINIHHWGDAEKPIIFSAGVNSLFLQA